MDPPTVTTDRRGFLRGVTAASVVALAGSAGCLGGGGGDDSAPPTISEEPDYGGWFQGVDNYGRTRDLRGQDSVTVRVGVQANGGNLGFGPAAVAVSPGTTVTWDWTGEGGQHNVVAQSGAFDSGKAVIKASTTFEHTFQDAGIFKYVCEPHKTVGMKGAVYVTDG